MLSRTLPLALLSALSLAASHNVDVGKDGLVFTPSTLTAAVGDKISFHFFAGNHSVAEGTFEAPCAPKAGGFYSGFLNPTGGTKEASQMFTLDITSKDPLAIYCSQVAHCQSGMVLVVNPNGKDSLDAYTKGAASAPPAKSPTVVRGGILSANKQTSSGSSSVSSSGRSSVSSSGSSSVSSSGSSTVISSLGYSATVTLATASPTASGGSGNGAASWPRSFMGSMGLIAGAMWALL